MPDDFSSGFDAIGAILAGTAADENFNLRALTERQPRLCARLKKLNFRHVAEILSGLLTQPDNHPATLRIEALIHLAALHCQGTRKPTLPQIREWLNDILLADPIGVGEDPVEDVFTSVVPSWRGCVTLFEGAWTDNAYYLQNVMATLLRLGDETWTGTVMHHVMSLLRLADEMARRSHVERYQMSAAGCRAQVKVAPRNVELGTAAVSFSLEDIFGLGLVARDIAPFVAHLEHIEQLGFEILGNTSLERRPLLRHEDGWLVTLPTAIGAAARRFVLESARSASALALFQSTLREVELQDVSALMLHTWEMHNATAPIEIGPRLTAMTAQFDVGGYALVVLATEDMAEVIETGLQGTDSFVGRIGEAVSPIEAELAARHDFKRGLTIVVHGGVGRGFALGFCDSPPGWHRLGLNLGDALRVGWDAEFTAKRVWKLLSQQEELPARGFHIANTNGFLNLYGYLQSQQFEYVPPDLAPPGMAMLATNYVGHARSRLRKAIDYHLVLGPDGKSLVEVQRRSTASFFKEISALPLFVAPLEAMNGRLLAVVESHDRPWWIDYSAGGSDKREFTSRIWDAAQRWMVRLAPILDRELPLLPDGPVWVRLRFPDIAELSEESLLKGGQAERPNVALEAGVICVDSPVAALSGYVDATNIAERYLISAIALGACALTGAKRNTEWADALAAEIMGSTDARFVHVIPAADVTQMIQSAIALPAPRFLMDEDRGWSHLGLAITAGRGQIGDVPEAEVGGLLQTAVLRLWERVREKLQRIDRCSIVVRALLNHEAIDKDRSEWAQTAAALLTLHKDKDDVLRAHNELEGRRAAAGVASRALAEMAICTSPTSGGKPCTDIDLDELIADVCAMLDCASQCDAYFYRLATAPLNIAPNGSFRFDTEFAEQLHLPYIYAHGERAFHDAAAGYADAFASSSVDDVHIPAPYIDRALESAMREEFGISFEHLVRLSHETAEMALEKLEPFVRLRRSEVLALIARFGPDLDVGRAYKALTLVPRVEWNEPKPTGALARDWQPWRMNRKLSLTRRPFIQLDETDDPEVLIFPLLAARAVRRMFELIDGHLGSEMFDSKDIDRWIGKVVHERGHAFNHSVAAKLREIGFEALPDQLMTQFGGNKALGDVDVLAWDRASGVVWAIECKRLQMDRTVGEIGERLADYTTKGTRKGKRTPIQKHLERLDFLHSNKASLRPITGLDQNKIILRSALITDRIVPMQFTKAMASLVDRVCDYRNIEKQFAGLK